MKRYESRRRTMAHVADHLSFATFLISSTSSPSAVAFSIAISSNPAQTSICGPSQTSRPNQPETVSLQAIDGPPPAGRINDVWDRDVDREQCRTYPQALHSRLKAYQRRRPHPRLCGPPVRPPLVARAASQGFDHGLCLTSWRARGCLSSSTKCTGRRSPD